MPGSDRLSRLYHSGPRSEPPARLDESILAAAKKSATGNNKSRYSPFGWGAPVSLAAVVVLSVTVILLMSREGVDPLQPEASKELRPAPESTAPKPAEPEQESKRAEAPAAFKADKLEKEMAPAPSANVAQDAATPAAPASLGRVAEESSAGVGLTSQKMVTASVSRNEVEAACDLALRKLAWFKDARISRDNNSRFEYQGKSFTGCVAVIEGDKNKLPPERGAGGDFYPRAGSDLAAQGWKVIAEADVANGVTYHVMRHDVFCVVASGGGGDSNVQSSTLTISVKCARNK